MKEVQRCGVLSLLHHVFMMEPSERLLLPFPVYGMAVLADGALAVVGGGGRMRSGVSNGCVSGWSSI